RAMKTGVSPLTIMKNHGIRQGGWNFEPEINRVLIPGLQTAGEIGEGDFVVAIEINGLARMARKEGVASDGSAEVSWGEGVGELICARQFVKRELRDQARHLGSQVRLFQPFLEA